ncbi:MAG: hypothetical protein ACI9C1_002123, partial [Candidatus Aldehydirespiratoraceae bacterium]
MSNIRFMSNAAVALSLLAAGCSDDTGDAAPTTTTTTTTTLAPTTEAPTTTVTTTTVAPTTTGAPAPHENQTFTVGINGIEVHGDSVWIASIAANEVIEVDRLTGTILTRVSTDGAGPDDVAIGPDGAVYWTGFLDGSIGRIENGTGSIVATLSAGTNPLFFTHDGELIVGIAITGDALYRVPTDGGEPELIAEPIGDMNGFDIEGTTVIGPTGGIVGPGSVTTVDLTSGDVNVVLEGLPAVTASTLGDDGALYLLAGGSAQVLRWDRASTEAPVVHTLPAGFYDNLSFADDGTLYVSNFST